MTIDKHVFLYDNIEEPSFHNINTEFKFGWWMPLVSACFDRRDGHVKEHDVPRILFHRHNLWEMVLCTGGTGAPVQSVMSLAGTQHFHTCHCLVSGLNVCAESSARCIFGHTSILWATWLVTCLHVFEPNKNSKWTQISASVFPWMMADDWSTWHLPDCLS